MISFLPFKESSCKKSNESFKRILFAVNGKEGRKNKAIFHHVVFYKDKGDLFDIKGNVDWRLDTNREGVYWDRLVP